MPEYVCPKCDRRHYGFADVWFCFCNDKVSNYPGDDRTKMERLR